MADDYENFREIRISLHGDPTHTRSAVFYNSMARAIGFRRRELGNPSLKEIEQQAGTYILIDGDDGGTKRQAYVGESQGVLGRLKYHHSSKGTKDFWEDTIVLVSKDGNLTKSHVMYVEQLLLSEEKNRRWDLSSNKKNPSQTAGRLTREDRMHMKNFVADAKILVGALGCDIFVASNEVDAGLPMFSFRGKEFDAKMQLSTSDHFIVKADSNAKETLAPTAPSKIKRLRQSMMDDGDLRPGDSSLVFNSDYSFSSVSAAAGVVCGSSINGRIAWTTDEGKTYGEWEAAQNEPPFEHA